MLNLPNGIKSVPTTLPLAVVFCLALALGGACSGRGLRPSSAPQQLTGTPLHEPAERGPGDPAKSLLASENEPPEPGELHLAAAAGDVEGVKRLVGKNPDGVNEKDSRGFTPLHEAAREGHTEVVHVLVAAGANPNDATTNGNQTPLHLAARIGSAEVCKALLAAGAELWPKDDEGTTAIGVAIQEGHVEIVRLLADANVKRLSHPISNTYNLSLPLLDGLHQAASSNNTEIMEIILENRRRLIEKDSNFIMYWREEDILDRGDKANNNTALHMAARNGSMEIARLLVQAGADATVQNGDNKTPAALADEQGHKALARMLEQIPKLFEAVAAGDLEAVKRLVEEEQATNRRHPRDGHTPLHEAARQGRLEVVQVLLKAGADLSLRDKSGEDGKGATALAIAIEEGHLEIAGILRNAGGLTNHSVNSSLKSAVFNGHTEMVRFLTEYLIEDGKRGNRSVYQNVNFDVDKDINSYYNALDEVNLGQSLLHVAAANGSTEIARLLVQAGAYVTAKNNDHNTPMDLAREQGHEDLAQMLEQVTALREAAVAGDAGKVGQLLAAGTPTEAQDPRGRTTLYHVVETYLEPAHLDPFGISSIEEDNSRPLQPATEGRMEVVRLLVQAGANVGAVTRWGNMHGELTLSNSNPLHVAALAGQAEIVGLLIEAGKDINGYLNFRNHRNAHNALSLALQNNPNEEVAKLLIQAGADVNAPHQMGVGFLDTPLHTVAAMHEDVTMSISIAKALIDAGANLNSTISRSSTLSFGVGHTPLHKAASVNHIEMVKLLLENGANINVKDDSDHSPLHLAIHGGHGELAKLLIESGAYIHSKNYNGNLPVQVAAFAGLPDVIKVLVEAGSPVNAQDQVGDTPLHDAALQGHVETTQVLLGAGADVNIKNNERKTPLDLAEQHGHGSVAEVLKAAGGER